MLSETTQENDLSTLKRHYHIKREGYPDMINYKAFCNDVTSKVENLDCDRIQRGVRVFFFVLGSK